MASTGIRVRASAERALWGRWVIANAVGEGIGLGGSILVGAGIVSVLGAQLGPWADVGAALLAVALGTFFEGVIVGFAQWRVLRGPLPGVSRGSWVWATAIGAGVAWLLGMVPSTVASLVTAPTVPNGGDAPPLSPDEPALGIVLLAAAALGLVLGPVLASAQFVVLRRHVERAGWWIPANAVAWALALPLTYLGPSVMFDVGASLLGVGILLACVVGAGAVVGVVHGWVLVRLLRHPLASHVA
jgi:hypothetical protein